MCYSLPCRPEESSLSYVARSMVFKAVKGLHAVQSA